MKLLEVKEIQLTWTDIPQLHRHPWQESERSPGVHVSSIIKHIALKMNMYSDEDRTDDMPLRVLVGMGFETMCAQLYKDMQWQPGEFTADGITGSPDGVEILTDGLGLHEFKYTAKSIRVKGARAEELKDIRAEWLWMTQVKAYLYLLSEHYREKVRQVCFHTCWAMGNYTKHTLDERYFKYTLEAEDAEVEKNWEMLLAHKDDVR